MHVNQKATISNVFLGEKKIGLQNLDCRILTGVQEIFLIILKTAVLLFTVYKYFHSGLA